MAWHFPLSFLSHILLHVSSQKKHLYQCSMCLLCYFIFIYFFCIYHSEAFLFAKEKEKAPLCWSTVRMDKWVRGFHYTLCFQSLHSRWLTFLKSFVQNVKAETALCRLHQHPQSLASSSIHSVPLFLPFFPISDVRLYTVIPTHCNLWVCFFLLFFFSWTDSPYQLNENLVPMNK